jgi:hypothetical protein
MCNIVYMHMVKKIFYFFVNNLHSFVFAVCVGKLELKILVKNQ